MKLIHNLQKSKKIYLVLFVVIFCLSFSTEKVFAQAYGDCKYGDGDYGTGCVATPTPGSSNNSGGTSGGGSGDGSGGGNGGRSDACTAQVPTASPDLFEIDVKGTDATLYIAPPPMPYSSYQISFGDGNKDEGYNVTFPVSNATGAIAYTVHSLQQWRTYSFKVRALNSCMPGNWSGDITVKAGATSSTSINKYYPSHTPTLSYVPQTKVTMKKQGTYQVGTPNEFVPTPQPHTTISNSMKNQNNNSQVKNNAGNIWETIKNFFSHLF